MRDLNFQLKQLCERNHDGSFATQADRERTLSLIGDQLHDLGYCHMEATSLRPKHVEALAAKWTDEGLAAGTIKNRMAALRWWAEKIGKVNVVARSNDHYGIPMRVFVTNVSRGKDVRPEQLARISDPFIRISLEFQAGFGVRLAESMKLQPIWADRGDILVLKDRWTKGGRAREIPILTAAQRDLLDAAKALAGKGSLIPAHLNFKQHLQRFKSQCRSAGINNVHGHRHFYAQERYKELTGWECPARGGPSARQLTAEQKVVDRAARLTISAELGHEREQITAIYLGR
jgi:site-specific recombinase XerC